MLTETLYSRLSDADGPLVNLVGGRIYPAHKTPTNPDLPFVIYGVVSQEDDETFDGPSGMSWYSIQVEAEAVNADEARSVMAAVRQLLHGWTGGQVAYSKMTDAAEEKTEEGYLVVQSYRMTATTVDVAYEGADLPRLEVREDGLYLDGEPVGGGGGVTDHAELDNLSYASSGHTGFAGTGVSNTFTAGQTFQQGLTSNQSITVDGNVNAGAVLAGDLGASVANLTTMTTGAGTAEAQDGSITPLTVKGAFGQSANLTNWKNSSGSTLASVGSSGTIKTNAINNNSGLVTLDLSTGTIIQNTHPAIVTLRLRALSGSTADLQQWQDENGNVKLRISYNGGFFPASMQDSDAADGTIYYSTSASKLSYKDSGGAVHRLY